MKVMTELALIVGGAAIIVLGLVELCLTAKEEDDKEPRWLNCVSGPYVMTRKITKKGRDW
jgi:hypothetical protein